MLDLVKVRYHDAIWAGPKESVVDMAWHPALCILVTISITGAVLIWTRVYRENWAAFAPDFEELHDNFVCPLMCSWLSMGFKGNSLHI